MRKSIWSILALAVIVSFASCEKIDSKTESAASIIQKAADTGEIVNVSSSNYERVEVEALERSEDMTGYTSGKLEYRENGELKASIKFEGDKALKSEDGDEDKEVDLKSKDGDYDKIIVEPLVKADDCDYIVAGTIEFHKDGEWIATIDFGDGSCDDLAEKTTADDDEVHVFSLDDWK